MTDVCDVAIYGLYMVVAIHRVNLPGMRGIAIATHCWYGMQDPLMDTLMDDPVKLPCESSSAHPVCLPASL